MTPSEVSLAILAQGSVSLPLLAGEFVNRGMALTIGQGYVLARAEFVHLVESGVVEVHAGGYYITKKPC